MMDFVSCTSKYKVAARKTNISNHQRLQSVKQGRSKYHTTTQWIVLVLIFCDSGLGGLVRVIQRKRFFPVLENLKHDGQFSWERTCGVDAILVGVGRLGRNYRKRRMLHKLWLPTTKERKNWCSSMVAFPRVSLRLLPTAFSFRAKGRSPSQTVGRYYSLWKGATGDGGVQGGAMTVRNDWCRRTMYYR